MLGLDVGNTSCMVAVRRQDALETIANEQGHRATPCVVGYSEVETLVGDAAQGQMARNPRNTVTDLLFMLGRSFDDAKLQEKLAGWRFGVSATAEGGVQVEVTVKGEAKQVPAARLLSLVVADVRGAADAFIGSPVKEVVLAVPPAFSEAQREALLEAARMGGMRVKHMISSPLAAALLYSHTTCLPSVTAMASEGLTADSAKSCAPAAPAYLLVVDVGGSSTSVTLLQRGAPPSDGSVADNFCTLASETAVGLGGSEVDLKLRQHVLKDIKRRSRMDLSDNGRAMARLLSACEACKRSLATGTQATVTVEADGADYFCNVTRAVLDSTSVALCNGVVELATRVIAQAGVQPSDVSAIVLAGGGARTLCVQSALSAVAPSASLHFASTAEEVVARGAALYGALVSGADNADGVRQSARIEKRPLLQRALGVLLADGSVHVLAAARSAMPLACAAAVAPTSSAHVLRVVELAESGDTRGRNADGARGVLELEVPPAPQDAVAIEVQVNVAADGAVAASCTARFAEGSEKEPVLLAAVDVPAPAD